MTNPTIVLDNHYKVWYTYTVADSDYKPFKTVDNTYRVWCKCCDPSALHYLTNAQAVGVEHYDCRLQDVRDGRGVDQFMDFIASIDAGVCNWVKVTRPPETEYDPYY